ncbi:MAG: hypothetical protein ILO68_06840, partial [Clostridia bacterium]|nr:hypothetical protein [Clostridia bacterium]
MKTRCKQILAAFCCLAVLIPALCGSVLPALAEDSYFEIEIEAGVGVLYLNVGQSVLLEDIALRFGEETVSGKDL